MFKTKSSNTIFSSSNRINQNHEIGKQEWAPPACAISRYHTHRLAIVAWIVCRDFIDPYSRRARAHDHNWNRYQANTCPPGPVRLSSPVDAGPSLKLSFFGFEKQVKQREQEWAAFTNFEGKNNIVAIGVLLRTSVGHLQFNSP
jgi:hypothetical protein